MKHKYITRFLFVLLALFSLLKLNAQLTYIPDDKFENKLINLGYDDVADNYVLTSNISGITTLNIAGSGLGIGSTINDITGIQDFTSLTWLRCSGNNFTNLDVSMLTSLEYLDCDNSQLTSLNVSGLDSLAFLHCKNNNLTNLDVNDLTSLTRLWCLGNNLTSLDVRNLTSLENLACNYNSLTSLDLSNLSFLTELYCQNNNLTSLNAANGNNINLVSFFASQNPDLDCIKVDDKVWMDARWSIGIDSHTSFSESSCDIDISVYNVDSQLKESKLGLTNLSIAADGSSATLFKYSSSEIENISFKVKEDQNNNPDLYGSFEVGVFVNDSLNVTYNHPKYFPEVNQQNKVVSIEIINSNTNEVFDEFQLKIVRPSVLMVHGIWSDGNKAFGGMMKRLLEEEMYLQSQLQYAEYAGDRHNKDNKFDFKSNGIDNLKRIALENNISLSKIDVLAHSNGGLLTRQYIQDNAYENDINKLITLNTPHSGSQLANYLLSNEAFAIYLRGLMAEHRFYTERGVIDDLRVDGNFIKNLNNHSIEQFSVMYESIGIHSIYSNQTVAGEVGNIDESIFFWLKYKSIDVFDNFLENDIFNTPNHDLVVPQSSQIGGAENTRLFQNQSHMGTASNVNIQNWIIDLLNQNSNNSDYFSSKGYNPLTLVSNYNAGKKQTSKVIVDETINIISPIAGTEINAGEIISIQANGSSGIENIVSTMGNIVVPIQNHITENSTSANFDFTIPNDALGKLEIVSAGFSNNGYEDFDSTYIIVTTDAILESIEIDQSLIYVPEGSKSTITILGHYDDGEIRNITNIDDLSYTFTQNNAEISETGLVTGLNEGEDILTVNYLGKSAIVPITIVSSISLSTEENIINNDKFMIFPNPVEDIVTIKFPLNETKAKVTIYNLLGQQILNEEIANSNNELNIGNIESGMYLLNIETEKGIISKRIIKN
ncbi:T9SS type A sorting domain-containing protein [Flavivirga sp. 57AJ16]|uniref:T9SS type A sorting domain-containing protein n=1 Tax=Flavivirga sp. 57AJ16 TaxID=3025307 RepID=UPI002366D1E1|nr:T9SS type A sorting domain-containing protein [Flavivirga sp. 57AJ16]MDD7885739.1 T9SS type A sorting domain-containing protein [Flavivirga sp. 57AJ16]